MRGRGTRRKNPLSDFEFNSGTLGLEQFIEVGHPAQDTEYLRVCGDPAIHSL